MAAANIVPSGVVLEVVTRDNFLDWSALMKNYLKGQYLWYDIVEPEPDPEPRPIYMLDYIARQDAKNWRSRNSKALHAIQLSCGHYTLHQIRNCETAQDAWNRLKSLLSEDVKADIEQGFSQNDIDLDQFHVAVNKGMSDRVIEIISGRPGFINEPSQLNGWTSLHVAVDAGQDEIVKELVRNGGLLTEKDRKGYTPFALAVKSTDDTTLVKWMLSQENTLVKNENEGDIPVILAATEGHKEMTRFLFQETPDSTLIRHGAKLLSLCIHAEIFDAAKDLLKKDDGNLIPLTYESDQCARPIYGLARIPTAIPGGSEISCWERFIGGTQIIDGLAQIPAAIPLAQIPVAIPGGTQIIDGLAQIPAAIPLAQIPAAIPGGTQIIDGLAQIPAAIRGGTEIIDGLAQIPDAIPGGTKISCWERFIDAATYLLQLYFGNLIPRPINGFAQIPDAIPGGTEIIDELPPIPAAIPGGNEIIDELPPIPAAIPGGNEIIDELPPIPAAIPGGNEIIDELPPIPAAIPGGTEIIDELPPIPAAIPGHLCIGEKKKKKSNASLAREILDRFCKRIKVASESQLHQWAVHDAMLQAAKYGNAEFIDSMREANPDLLWVKDKNKRGIYAHAILNRKASVFTLMDKIGQEGLKTSIDIFRNNLLHIAAELGPSSYRGHRSNAALQMLKELQWFQAVENIVPDICKEAKNADGLKPREVFTKNHEQLIIEGRKWAKETASSFTIVGTLIITIMFAAAFTVPGGNDQDKGFPMFLNKTAFDFFILTDALSLIASSSSVLMFIGILTSRYAEEDFRYKLPYKLLFGLLTIFLSVLFMLFAFCSGLVLMLHGYRWIIITGTTFSIIPIGVFLFTIFGLFGEILKSLFGSI